MGNRWGREKRERGGGGQFTSNVGPEWTGVTLHTKEGFQVSKRDLGTGEGSPGKGGITKGNIRGIRQGVCAMISYIVNSVYIVLLCVCG
jgi:hypothetical protein